MTNGQPTCTLPPPGPGPVLPPSPPAPTPGAPRRPTALVLPNLLRRRSYLHPPTNLSSSPSLPPANLALPTLPTLPSTAPVTRAAHVSLTLQRHPSNITYLIYFNNQMFHKYELWEPPAEDDKPRGISLIYIPARTRGQPTRQRL